MAKPDLSHEKLPPSPTKLAELAKLVEGHGDNVPSTWGEKKSLMGPALDATWLLRLHKRPTELRPDTRKAVGKTLGDALDVLSMKTGTDYRRILSFYAGDGREQTLRSEFNCDTGSQVNFRGEDIPYSGEITEEMAEKILEELTTQNVK